MTNPRWASARYGAAGMVAGLMLAWLLGGGRAPSVHAAGPGPLPAQANGTMAFTSAAPGPTGAQYLYLIDTRTQALAVYSVNPSPQRADGVLKLEAARRYEWDLKLNEYNNAPPTVSAIESTVGAAKR